MPQDISTLQQEIRAVVDKVQQADKAYYDDATAVKMSDDEYDALKESLFTLGESLRAQNPTDPLIQEVDELFESVGATPVTGGWQKCAHPIPMQSLHKVKGVQGIKEWFAKIESVA